MHPQWAKPLNPTENSWWDSALFARGFDSAVCVHTRRCSTPGGVCPHRSTLRQSGGGGGIRMLTATDYLPASEGSQGLKLGVNIPSSCIWIVLGEFLRLNSVESRPSLFSTTRGFRGVYKQVPTPDRIDIITASQSASLSVSRPEHSPRCILSPL